MSKRTFKSNPTGVIEIDKSRVNIVLNRDHNQSIDSFSIRKLDLSDLDIPQDSVIFIIAYSNLFEKRTKIGKVSRPELIENIKIESNDGTRMVFRIIIREREGNLILASAEGIQGISDAEEPNRTSLLPLEYTNLGEKLWEVKLAEGNKPHLLVNEDGDLGLRQKITDKDPLFYGSIVSQAFEAGLIYLALNPAPDEDESLWQNVWCRFIRDHGYDEPPFIDDISDIDSVYKWANVISAAFANDIKFATSLVNSNTGIL